MRGLKQDRSARLIAAGTRSSRTFAVATMSLRSTSLRLGGWRSRWPTRLGDLIPRATGACNMPQVARTQQRRSEPTADFLAPKGRASGGPTPQDRAT
jgi:hypothetical protein